MYTVHALIMNCIGNKYVLTIIIVLIKWQENCGKKNVGRKKNLHNFGMRLDYMIIGDDHWNIISFRALA